jgi:hypothetical protein
MARIRGVPGVPDWVNRVVASSCRSLADFRNALNPREADKFCAEMNNLADKKGKVCGPVIEGMEELRRQFR